MKFIILFPFIFSENLCSYTASRRELRGDFHPVGFAGLRQIVQYFVSKRFVKNASAAVALHIKFKALQFYALFIRAVFDCNLAEIRLAGLRAKARKFRAIYRDAIIPLPLRITEQFNLGFLIHIIEPLHKIS
jgi:hypothetical protein